MPSISSVSSSTVSSYVPKVTQVLDTKGGLYAAKLPDSSEEDTSTGFVYSSKALTTDNPVPSTALYLKDKDGNYFSVDADKMSMVLSGKELNLYVYQADGTANKYAFGASNGVMTSDDSTAINAINFTAVETSSGRDLNGDGEIGALLRKADSEAGTSGLLDTVGGMYRVNSLGQDLFVVSPGLDKAKGIDVSKSTLLNADGQAWTPDTNFVKFAAVSSKDTSGKTVWNVYATDTEGSTTLLHFDADRKLVEADTQSLSLQDLAAAEKKTLRDLNQDDVYGVTISGTIDSTTGLFQGSVLNQDFYLVGNALKSGTAKAPTDLGGALLTQDGQAWALPDDYIIGAMVKKSAEGDPDYAVYVYQKDDKNVVLRFDFIADDAHHLMVSSASADGIEVDASALAAAEKSAKRDLNDDTVYGIKIDSEVDKLGGLYAASALGHSFLLVGKALTSSASKPLDLSSALKTTDGQAWQPDGVETVAGHVRLVALGGSQGYEAYVREDSGTFAKYTFDAQYTQTDERVELSQEDLAAAEKLRQRDLNGDTAYGVNVQSVVDAKVGLYTGQFESQQGIYLQSSTKLALGSKVASNGVDMGSALKVGTDYWNVDDGYTVKSGYADGSNFFVIASANGNPNDVRRYAFADKQLIDDESLTGNLSLKDLTALEKQLGRDLNGDLSTGVKAGTTLDKVGGLHTVTMGSGENAQTFLVVNSKASAVKDLSGALLNSDGQAWQPEGVGSLGGNVRVVTLQDASQNITGYQTYVTEDSGQFARYTFDSQLTQTGDKEELTQEDLAAAELDKQRDFNGDASYGVKVNGMLDARGGLYTGNFGSLQGVYLQVSDKLTVGKGGASLDSALKLDTGEYWQAEQGYTAKAGYASVNGESGTYVVIAASDSNPYDLRQYTFKDRVLVDDDSVTGAISMTALSAQETALGRDLNGDHVTGVKVSSTLDKIGGLHLVSLGSGDSAQNYLTVGAQANAIKNLNTALVDTEGNAWRLGNEQNVIALYKQTSNGEVTGYDLYTSQTLDAQTGEKQITRYRFDANYTYQADAEDGTQVLSAIDTADIETQTQRDLNGDKSVGAPVTAVWDKTGGLYQASMRNGTDVQDITLVSDMPPGRATALSSKMLLAADETSAWKVEQGYTLRSVVSNKTGDSVTGYTVYASKDSDPQQMLAYSFDGQRVLSDTQTLGADQLVSAEKAAGRDLNSDKIMGLAVGDAVDRKGALYKASLLGQNYLVAGTVGSTLKSGKTTELAVDLSRALLTAEGTAWNVESDWNIAGMVANDAGGVDVYTYQKTDNNVSAVQVHSWDSGFVYAGATDADPVALVQLENSAQRDLSGDGVVGFRKLDTLTSGYTGVTEANVTMGTTFILAGTNLKNKLGIKDALLSDDGSAPWRPDEGFTIKAVDDSDPALTSGKRYVYATNTSTQEVRRYEFDKTSGKVSGEGSTVSVVEFTAKEVARKRDFNGDGSTGVASVAAVLDGIRATGLLTASLNGSDYLVVNKLPAIGRNANLAGVLLNADGSAWQNPSGFAIKGVYESTANGASTAEVYGVDADKVIQRYVFTQQADGAYSLQGDAEQVTGTALALREATAGKDLNGDVAIGFKVGNTEVVKQPDGISLGTAAIDTPDTDPDDSTNDSPTVYIVGKNLGQLGTAANKLANNAALLSDSGYWSPAQGETVVSMDQRSATDGSELRVYTQVKDTDTNTTSYVRHTFALNDNGQWALHASADLSSKLLISDEVSLARDLNNDSAWGLKTDSGFTVPGMSRATIDEQAYYFVGSVSTGTKAHPLDLSNTKLLLDKDGSTAWTPPADAALTSWEILSTSLPSDAPDTAKYQASWGDSGHQYFDSSMKALDPKSA